MDFPKISTLDRKSKIEIIVTSILFIVFVFAFISGMARVKKHFGAGAKVSGKVDVLKELGELLNSNSIFRNNDIIGRYGGEEFIVILPETNSEYAKSPAERLRKELKEKKFYSNGEIFHVTISIGISEFKTSDKSCEDLIDRADKALYYAKSHGKNMTIIYEDIFKE